MNRRIFLASLLSPLMAKAAQALPLPPLPEVLPPVVSLLSPEIICAESLRILESHLRLANVVAGIPAADCPDWSAYSRFQSHKGIDITLSDPERELRLALPEFRERYIEPAMSCLANHIQDSAEASGQPLYFHKIPEYQWRRAPHVDVSARCDYPERGLSLRLQHVPYDVASGQHNIITFDTWYETLAETDFRGYRRIGH